MPLQSLQSLFKRDLNKLIKEINAYQDESNLWLVEKEVSNSAGNLCLHLVGNLNHFIGTHLGATGYVRQRPLEFSTKNTPRTEMIELVTDTAQMIETTLQNLNAEQLQADYPLEVFGHKMTTEYFLLHLSTHLNYHLGQINYHRRLLDV